MQSCDSIVDVTLLPFNIYTVTGLATYVYCFSMPIILDKLAFPITGLS